MVDSTMKFCMGGANSKGAPGHPADTQGHLHYLLPLNHAY